MRTDPVRVQENARAAFALLFGCFCAVAVMQLDVTLVVHEDVGLPGQHGLHHELAPSELLQAGQTKGSGSDAFDELSKAAHLREHSDQPSQPSVAWQAKHISLVTKERFKEAEATARQQRATMRRGEAQAKAAERTAELREADRQADRFRERAIRRAEIKLAHKRGMPKSNHGYAPPAMGMIEQLRRAQTLIQSHIDAALKIQASLPTVAKPSKQLEKVLQAGSLKKRLAVLHPKAHPKANAEVKIAKAIKESSSEKKGSGNQELDKLLSASRDAEKDLNKSAAADEKEQEKADEEHGSKEFKELLKNPDKAVSELDTSHKGESIVRFLKQEQRAIKRQGADKTPPPVKAVIERELAVEAAAPVVEHIAPVATATATPVDAAMEAAVTAPAEATADVEALSTKTKVQIKPHSTVDDFIAGDDRRDGNDSESESDSDSDDPSINIDAEGSPSREAIETEPVDFSKLEAEPQHDEETREQADAVLHDPLHQAIKAKQTEAESMRLERISSSTGRSEVLDSLLNPDMRANDEEFIDVDEGSIF